MENQGQSNGDNFLKDVEETFVGEKDVHEGYNEIHGNLGEIGRQNAQSSEDFLRADRQRQRDAVNAKNENFLVKAGRKLGLLPDSRSRSDQRRSEN